MSAPRDASVAPAVQDPTASYLADVAGIVPSKTNPRKKFDGPEFDELVASIARHGVLQPLIVRPVKRDNREKLEIVAGERRWRAAQAAGLKRIPVISRLLTDESAQEIQIIENLQRQDVTALEESAGYVQLVEARVKAEPKTPRQELVASIAKQIGKSPRYVYARMKLSALVPEVKQAIAEGRLPVSHGDELVRLAPDKQQKALKSLCFERWGENAGKQAVSHRALKAAIALEFQADLTTAPWNLFETMPAVKPPGRTCACSVCPLNSSNDESTGEKDVCADSACYRAKAEAFVQVAVPGQAAIGQGAAEAG